ncbi:exosortase-associated EpsI family protein [Telmatocola sphagniphila]|uniref:Exosortase-associated EpsI family protein n=1 Tax=Telmatocola sphagniphila TaxID=1123043 RepID=A0A8E6ETU3_9BACT|nr:exosortase-associated EpsI family protein [Telmatocola sphagniphila]QVL30412.1 exosortase-associated EpsI family protein [Telmatocola sphagniphila]
MKPQAFFILAIVLVGSSLVHGHYSGRWEDFTEIRPVLNQLPEHMGDWTPGNFLKIDSRELAFQSSAEHRIIRHVPSNRNIVLSLTSGRPAVVAVHTPDVCYVGSGFQAMTQARRVEVPTEQGPATLWCCDFQKNEERIRVYWSWSDGSRWQAPDSPRWQFARTLRLWKLYVVHPLETGDDWTVNEDSLNSASPLLNALSAAIRR